MFVGSITNNTARAVSIPTTFLEKKKKYLVRMYQDDDSVATKTKVSISEKKIKAGDVLKFDLKANGGVALYITEIRK